MNNIKYTLVEEKHIRAYFTLPDDRTIPVWVQQSWADEEGEFARYVRKNGCGHCCVSMALVLNGVTEFEPGVPVNPYNEFLYCRKLWGAPDEFSNPKQRHFLSCAGITKVLRSMGVPADYFGIEDGNTDKAAQRIEALLREDKTVIFCSHKTERIPDNPFSDGSHWVYAVGFSESGKIVVANSSVKKYPDGIHEVDTNTIAGALCENCTPADLTWGIPDSLNLIAGCIVIG